MPEELSNRQRHILEAIRSTIQARGYPPSVREIGRMVGLSSSSTVHGYLQKLEEKGYIRRDASKPRAIEVLEPDAEVSRTRTIPVPLVGRVSAGQPVIAAENIEDIYTLPRELTGEGELFMLTVKGDSMIEAGILEGDLVLVRHQPTAENGDIVLAMLGEEATIKRFFRDGRRIRLQPENRFYQPIIVDEARILGKVIGLFRRYR